MRHPAVGRARAAWPVGPWARRLPASIAVLVVVGLLSLAVVPLPAARAAGSDVPIAIDGDAQLAASFGGPGRDGLTWGTAFVIEGLTITGTHAGTGILVEHTSGHLIIRNCTVSDLGRGDGDAGIKLNGCADVRVTGCVANGDGIGIYAWDSRNVTVSDNRCEGNNESGIRVELAPNATVNGNVASGNRMYGIKLWTARDARVLDNTVERDLRSGLDLQELNSSVVARNRATGNGRGVLLARVGNSTVEGNGLHLNAGGLRLENCDNVTVAHNTVESSAGPGIALWRSTGIVVSENDVRGNTIGILLQESRGNWVLDNNVTGSAFGGIEDQSGLNVIRGNVLSWNGWATWLAIGVSVLMVVAAVMVGVVVLLRRRARRRLRALGPVVVVERRFAPGRRGLWAVSKWVSNESIFISQLQAAGPNRERLLARYEQSMSSARNAQWAQTIAASVMLGIVSALPLSGVAKLAKVSVTAANINDTMFATAISVALYHIMVLVMLLVFGVMFLVSIMEGEAFKFIASFPVSGADIQRLKTYVFLRMYGLPIAVVLLVFPVGGFVLTRSWPFLLMALGTNALAVAFIGYVLIILAHLLRSRVFSADASGKATVLRVVIMSGYLIAAMFVYLVLQYLIGVIQGLFTAERLAGGTGETLNMLLGLVPFPFADSYLVAASLMPGHLVPLRVLAASLVGTLLLAACVYGLSRKGNRLLQAIAMEDAPRAGRKGPPVEVRVRVEPGTPVRAFMRKSMLMASRDMGGLTYIILPIILPLIMVVSLASGGRTGSLEALASFAVYLGFIPFMLNTGLSSADEGLGGLLSSLPFRMRDLFRARQALMSLLMLLITLLAIGVSWAFMTDPWTFATMALSTVPLDVVLVYLFLMLYSSLFGRVNRQHTLFAANVENKTIKYIAIIVTMYIVVIVELGALGAALAFAGAPLAVALAGLLVANIVLASILELGARRMFPA